jgi:nucleotide-binding universal stress UspA family protein
MKNCIMVCVDLSPDSVNLITEDLKSWDWEKVGKVILIHGYRLQQYSGTFQFNSFLPENQYSDVHKAVEDALEPLEEIVKEASGVVEVVRHCIISSSIKKSLTDYAKEEGIDSMVIGTRGESGVAGLFSSSFAEYMVRHAHCELRIIREG